MKITKNVIYIVFIGVILCHVTTVMASCQPIVPFDFQYILTGFSQPVCSSILQTSGITHHWVDDSQMPLGNATACGAQAQYVVDLPVKQLSTTFTQNYPSSLCQQLLALTMCHAQFKPCDPAIDTAEGGYITKKKPCKWLCESVQNEAFGACTLEDQEYLRTFGISLGEIDTGLAQLNCNDTEIWSDGVDDEDCRAPGAIPHATTANQCVRYEGTYCSAVFPPNTYVMLQGSTFEEIESKSDSFANTLLAMPRNEPLCGASLTRMICSLLFPECMTSGLRVESAPNATLQQKAQLQTSLAKYKDLQFPLPLRPSMSTCNDYVDYCTDAPFFNSPLVTASVSFPYCPYYPALRYNACFPTAMAVEDYTTEQIELVNKVNGNYDFNAVMFLDKYGYSPLHYSGPDTPQPIIFTGSAWSGETFQVKLDELPYADYCTPPMVFPEKYYEEDELLWGQNNIFGGRCAIPCPSPALSSHDRKVIEIVSLVLVGLAFIFSGILSLTFLIFKSQRHKWLLASYTISYWFVTIFMLHGLLYRHGYGSVYDRQCDSNTMKSHMTGFGLYQGIGLIFTLLLTSAYWFSLSIDLFERLILGRVYRRGTTQYKRRQFVMHAFAWISSALATAGLAVGYQIGYDGALPFAWIAPDPRMLTQPINLAWAFFLGPIAVYAFLGFLSIAIIAFFLIQYDPSDGLNKYAEDLKKQNNCMTKFRQLLKLFNFVFLMFLFLILMIRHEIDVGTSLTDWRDALIVWGERRILLTWDPTADVPVTDYMGRGRIILCVFGITSIGIAMFLLYFVFAFDIIQLWCGLLYYKAGLTIFKSWAKEDTATGTDSAATGSSGSSGSAGSTDIFGSGGDHLRRKKGTTTDTVSGASDGSNVTGTIERTPSHNNLKDATIGLNTSAMISSSGIQTPARQSSATPNKLDQKRKAALFKGFASLEPIKPVKRSQSQSQDHGMLPMSPSPMLTTSSPTSPLSHEPLNPISPIFEGRSQNSSSSTSITSTSKAAPPPPRGEKKNNNSSDTSGDVELADVMIAEEDDNVDQYGYDSDFE